MELKAERIARWAVGKPQSPVRIELHPTNRCNLRCRFCWQSTVKKIDDSSELSDEKLFSIVREAAALGAKEWIVSGGGEPLVRRNATINILKLIKKYGMWGQLTTNGALFKEEDVRKLVEVNWDQVQISIDGPSPKIQDYLRGKKGTFIKATETARLFSKHKNALGKEQPYLGFNTVLNRLNYNKVGEMVELAYDVGFQLVYFEPIYAGYLSKERLTLNEEEKKELRGYAKKAKRKANKLKVATNIDRFIQTKLVDKSDFKHVVLRETENSYNRFISAPCYQPWYLLGIKADGLVGCCSTFEIGEYIQNKTLKGVWFGKIFNEIRKNMLDKNLPDYCSKCSVVVVMDNKDIRKRLKRKI